MSAFLTSPSPSTFGVLRSWVAASDTYDPLVRPDAVARPLLDNGDARAAITALEALMPGAFLVPSAHALLARAYADLDDAAAVGRHETMADAALAGILATGAGTPEHPWTVLTVAEEYDVLAALGRPTTLVGLVTRDGVSYDVHDLADGSTAWFALAWTPAGVSE